MIALAEKGLKYTLKEKACRADIPKDKDLTALYRSIHPDQNATVLVPILQHHTKEGDVNIIESVPCAEYIEDAFPDKGPSLRPASPKQRNAIRMFLEIAGKWMPFGVVFSKTEDLGARLREFAVASKNLNAALEKWGEPGGDFLLGANFSMAEVIIAPFVMRFGWWDYFRGINALKTIEELGCDRLARWVRAVQSRKSVTETFHDMERETQLNYFKFRGSTPCKATIVVKGGTIELTHIDGRKCGANNSVGPWVLAVAAGVAAASAMIKARK
eukprot:gb/GFBE01024141.1/.p2 GENE.gb/GFBE01024141.1/~~gb/GFBE01024141.1/.p2  ORF type:complete len:272 (-),score=62.61 gb/GFBE01024141.1/:7-822(-)